MIMGDGGDRPERGYVPQDTPTPTTPQPQPTTPPINGPQALALTHMGVPTTTPSSALPGGLAPPASNTGHADPTTQNTDFPLKAWSYIFTNELGAVAVRYALDPRAIDILSPIFKTDFHYDLSQVRLEFGYTHGHPAFTLGDEVTLDQDEWNKTNERGRIKLLAHEITHSVQFERMGNTHLVNFSFTRFMYRYIREYYKNDNYHIPGEIRKFSMSDLNVVDSHFTLDQIAEYVADQY
jgi:hypothetical protein